MVVDTPYPLNRVRVRWILLLPFPAVVKSITTVGSRAFHKDKRRIPGTSDRPTTKRTRRSIGGANGGIRPSPLDPIPLPRENRTRRRASPRQIPRRLFIIQPPCCCSPFPSPPLHFTSIRATLNQRFREKRAAGDLFAIRFQKRGEKDRGDRIWPPREIIGFGKKKESNGYSSVDGKDFQIPFLFSISRQVAL